MNPAADRIPHQGRDQGSTGREPTRSESSSRLHLRPAIGQAMQRDIDQGVTKEGQHGRPLSEGGDKAVPPRCRATRVAGGWRRRPMGAGCPRSASRPRRIGSAWFWIVLIALLAINWLAVLMAQPAASRG